MTFEDSAKLDINSIFNRKNVLPDNEKHPEFLGKDNWELAYFTKKIL